MNENLRLIPKAAETIFKGGITLLKIISLRGASCFQRDFFASLGGACGFTASEEEGTPVTYSCGYGEIPPEGYMLELKGDCAELRASDLGEFLAARSLLKRGYCEVIYEVRLPRGGYFHAQNSSTKKIFRNFGKVTKKRLTNHKLMQKGYCFYYINMLKF